MNSTIYTNMDSVRNYNIFNKNASNASKAMERATTGLKIIGAKDGTSQYAISEKMRERINSNEQASQNVQNSNAMARSADAGLENTINILKTLKARAINAANDSNTGEAASTASDRLTIQKEIDALLEQIDYNATNTQYNGKTLLNGTYDGEKVITDSKTAALSTDITANNKSNNLSAASIYTGDKSLSLVISWTSGGKEYYNDDITTASSSTTLTQILTAVTSKTGFTTEETTKDQAMTNLKDENNDAVMAPDTGTALLSKETGKAGYFSDLKVDIILNSTGESLKTLEFKEIQEGKDKSDGETLNFQVGESANMSMQLNIADMSAKGLGIQNLDVTTQRDAKYSIDAIDKALQTALEQQTSLGAMEQRLGYTADTLDTINENLQASDSTIRDANMAKEISTYMKWNVLMQASQYMLAQSNQNAYAALNLLQ